MKIRVGSRSSDLAIKQIDEIEKLLPELQFQRVLFETAGDIDRQTSLLDRENTDFFTDTIEAALVAGDIDLAIHSAKDLEDNPPEDLIVAAMTKSKSPYDAIVSKDGLSLDKLKSGAVVGTSSRNRRDAILNYRDDLIVKDIRGNVDNRIAQLDAGDYDAIVVAHIALVRLGLEDRVSQILDDKIIKAHPLQGRLALQIHKDNKELFEILRGLDGK